MPIPNEGDLYAAREASGRDKYDDGTQPDELWTYYQKLTEDEFDQIAQSRGYVKRRPEDSGGGPHRHDMIQELREALGLTTSVASKTPEAVWNEAIQHIEGMRLAWGNVYREETEEKPYIEDGA